MKYNWREVASEIFVDGMLIEKRDQRTARANHLDVSGKSIPGGERTCKGSEVGSAWQVEEMQGGDTAGTEGAGGH